MNLKHAIIFWQRRASFGKEISGYAGSTSSFSLVRSSFAVSEYVYLNRATFCHTSHFVEGCKRSSPVPSFTSLWGFLFVRRPHLDKTGRAETPCTAHMHGHTHIHTEPSRRLWLCLHLSYITFSKSCMDLIIVSSWGERGQSRQSYYCTSFGFLSLFVLNVNVNIISVINTMFKWWHTLYIYISNRSYLGALCYRLCFTASWRLRWGGDSWFTTWQLKFDLYMFYAEYSLHLCS